MKYIMMKCKLVKDSDDKRFMPFIFPHFLVHSIVHDSAVSLLESHGYTEIECVSAGECNFIGDEINCGGSSSTLKLESRGELDDDIIRKYNYFHGMDEINFPEIPKINL